MADRVKASSDNLEQIAQKLRSIESSLSSAYADLNRIHFSGSNGGNVYVGSGVSGLSGLTGSARISGGRVSSMTRRIGASIQDCSQYSRSLAGAVTKVENAFSGNEQKLKGSFYGAAGVRPVVPITSGTWFQDRFKDMILVNKIPESVPWHKKIFNIFTDVEWHNFPPTHVFPRIGDNNIFDTIRTTSTVFGAIGTLYEGIKWEDNGHSKKVEGTAKGKFKIENDAIKDFNDSHNAWKDSEKTWYRDDKGWFKGDKDNPVDGRRQHSAKRGNVGISAGVSYSDSISYMEGEAAYENGPFSAKGSMKVANAEWHASAEAGMYQYKIDENGKKVKVFAPGASAKIGGSATLLSLDGSADLDLGNGMTVGVGGDIAVMKGSAEAGVEAGYVDGKFALNAKASAELNVIEANVNAHGGIDGIADIKGEAGVTVGIGAHADIGYHDGVIKCDIGASLGIGVKLNVSIDISEGIETVSNLVNEGMNVIADVGEGVSDFVNWLFS